MSLAPHPMIRRDLSVAHAARYLSGQLVLVLCDGRAERAGQWSARVCARLALADVAHFNLMLPANTAGRSIAPVWGCAAMALVVCLPDLRTSPAIRAEVRSFLEHNRPVYVLRPLAEGVPA